MGVLGPILRAEAPGVFTLASATIFEVEEYEVQGLARRLERFLPSELEEDSYATSAVIGTEDRLLLSASYGIVIRYLTGIPMGHQ